MTIDLSELLGKILGKIANTEDRIVPQITLIGPKRSGKSTSVRQIAKDLNQRIGKDYAQYRAYDSHFWSWWEEADFNSTQIYFFDNIYPIWSYLTSQSYEDLVNRSSFGNQILVVMVLDSIEYQSLRLSYETSKVTVFDKEPFEYYFKRPSLLEIENIIMKRAESLGKPNLFPSEVLKTIGGLSLGLPGLALWLARNLISAHENQEKSQKFTSALVHKIAQYLGFEPALKLILEHDLYSPQIEYEISDKVWPALHSLQESNVESSPLIQTLRQSRSNIKSWKPLLEEIALLSLQSDTIRRSELQEKTGIKESSLTYQCQNLVKERVVTYSKSGREVFYQLRSPVKEALELILAH